MALVKSFFYLGSDFLLVYFAFAVFSSRVACTGLISEFLRIRGLSGSKTTLYIPDEYFTCLDGSFKVPFLHVNDDYCDCPDGSDEPGTSACPNTYFHCINAGFKPSNIPSSRVNDGVCDCCDGDDEYSGKVKCEDTCYELGEAERIEAERQAEISKRGFQTKLRLIVKGKQLKEEKLEKLKQLELDKMDAEIIKAEKEKLKLEAEELEKMALEEFNKLKAEEEKGVGEESKETAEEEAFQIFKLLDSNSDERIQWTELQVRQTFDQNRDGVVSEEEAKFFLNNNEELDWDNFLLTGWPKMKPFFMMEKGLFKSPEVNLSKTDDEIVPEEGDGVGAIEDVTDEYQKERQKAEEEGGSAVEHQEAEEEEEEEEEEEDQEQSDKEEQRHDESEHEYDEETQKLVNAAKSARSEFEEADRAVRDIHRTMSQCQEYLEKDFGPEEEFAPLEGQCFEYTDREYLYKLCPFDQAIQQPRSGESEVKLGQWSKWAGPEQAKYEAMLYDKGQSCWNGPQRSTLVKLKCGIENVITSVTEPNKCEYHFEFSTPSACQDTESVGEKNHDEL